MMSGRARRWAANLGLLVVSSALALALVEWAARRLEPLDPYHVMPLGGRDGMFVPDRRLGHALRPGFHGRFTHPQYGGEEVTIGAHGFRVAEGNPSSAAPSVLVLGDSIAFGLGVRAAEAFPGRLADMLSRRAGVAIHVTSRAGHRLAADALAEVIPARALRAAGEAAR